MPSNPADTTLNPLPGSVNINPGLFSISILPTTAPATGNIVKYAVSGDLTGDGYPEVIWAGWDASNGGATPAQVKLNVVSTGPGSDTQPDAATLLGISSIPGESTFVRIADFNGDGRNDVLLNPYNEHPFYPEPITLLLNTGSGFTAKTLTPGVNVQDGGIGNLNGDNLPDFVTATYQADKAFDPFIYAGGFFGPSAYPPQLVIWLNKGNGDFQALPVVGDAPLSVLATRSDFHDASGGSGAAIADFDNNGVADIVVTDYEYAPMARGQAYNGQPFPGNTTVIANIQHDDKSAWGTAVQLPAPYFEASAYTDYFSSLSTYHDVSHDHTVQVMDFNNDGLTDILVHSTIFTADGSPAAGVLQFLQNKGNLQFEDVTATTLYNSYIGKTDSSHQPVLMDVNGDGFIDIVDPDVSKYNSDKQTQMSKSWSNEILINTGTGKFVSEMWDGFHTLYTSLLSQLAAQGLNFPSNTEEEFSPYMTPGGVLGFTTMERVWNGSQNVYAFADIRANGKLYTGPGGANPALQGAAGFNEAYYLTQYADVAAAVSNGTYASGLAQYLAVGRAAGNFAFAANATVQGSESGDTITLREGNETALGYGGGDTLIGGAGNDLLDGGDGSDLASYAAARADLTLGLVSGGFTVSSTLDGTDTLKNIEAIQAEGVTYVLVGGSANNDTLANSGAEEEEDALVGGAGTDTLSGGAWRDFLSGGEDSDTLTGGGGNDILDGGSNVDTAVFSGAKAAYTITQGSNGGFTIAGPDGTDTLVHVEYAKFDDQTVRLLPGSGTAVDFAAAPSAYMAGIRDFDGGNLTGQGTQVIDPATGNLVAGPAWDGVSGWSVAGSADVSGSGLTAQILFNNLIGRWAEVTTEADGKVYFDNYNWGGDSRIVGIYTDPEVALGHAVQGGPDDSQRRFQNDLFIGNIKSVVAAGDYNHDGFQEVYFSLTDGTAYLHALMWNDGNIQYANYQNAQQVQDYLTANGVASSVWSSWLHEEPIQVFTAPGAMTPPLLAQTGATLAGVAV